MRALLFILFTCAFAKALAQQISPQTYVVDILRIAATIDLDFDKETVQGAYEVDFLMLEDANEVLLDAKDMTVSKSLSTSSIAISSTKSHIILSGDFKKGNSYSAQFTYTVQPKQAAYFVNRNGKSQFWTQGQGKYTSHWLPSIDDMNDKIEFDVSIIEDGFTAIANGIRNEESVNGAYLKTNFDMQQPMSSYLVSLVAGDYMLEERLTTSATPLQLYYYPEDIDEVEPTYRHSVAIFDFLEKEIGVPYPWKIYSQVPVKDFIYAGMENTAATTFADTFVVDSIGYIDRNYLTINAHELSHQWFGNMVTETKSEHHWLHEGFATYYALLAERAILGDDYFYFKLFESAEQLRELSDAGKGQTLVAAGGSSLTYYQKGAWAIHILRNLVGEAVFREAVKNYVTNYAYRNVTTQDFMNEVKALSDVSLDNFEKNWLYQSAFQSQEALDALKKSDFMKNYFNLQALRTIPLNTKIPELRDAINSAHVSLSQEAVYQLSGEDIKVAKPLYMLAFQSEDLLTRQAISLTTPELRAQLEPAFKTLLNDESYVTQERALFTLWSYYKGKNDADGQKETLDALKDTFGFTDGNVRTLWLALSLVTPTYEDDSIESRYKELVSYTKPQQKYVLRQNAFRYINQLGIMDAEILRNLVEASTHHYWRFRDYARELLHTVLQNPNTQEILTNVLPKLSAEELAYLERIDKL